MPVIAAAIRCLAAPAAGLLLLFAGGAVCAAGAETGSAPSSPDKRPLPDRWEARYLAEPVFGSRLYLVEAGPRDAPPVLLVHGLGASGYGEWRHVIDALESDYHVIAFDLPGFGRSTGARGPLSPPRYARLLGWLTERLELEHIRLVGHSMGAAIALYYAANSPQRIDSVVLADVAGVLQRVAYLRAVVSARLLGGDLPSFLAEGLKRLFNLGSRMVERLMLSTEVEIIQLLRASNAAWNVLLSDRSSIDAALSLIGTDFSRAIARFDLPVTLIWGGRDRVAPIRTGYLLNGRLPRSELHIIEGADHAPMLSKPKAFVRLLRNALAHPPQGQSRTEARTQFAAPRGDFTCRGREGGTISGSFERIVIEHCPGMRLVDVRARHIRIANSPRVLLRHVEIVGGASGAGLVIVQSGVTATDVRIDGAPAVRIDGGRLDLAGGVLVAPGPALVVERRSTVVLSVSRVISGVRVGFLHGAVRTAHTVLDAAPAVRSRVTQHERIRAMAHALRPPAG